MPNGTATDFLKSLPWNAELEWQGKSTTIALDGDRRATITLKTRGVVDHYTGVEVEITSKTAGPIKSKWFDFDEYLKDRADNRRGYPLGRGTRTFEVIAYVGWHWYIAIPQNPEHFTQAVEYWISLWR